MTSKTLPTFGKVRTTQGEILGDVGNYAFFLRICDDEICERISLDPCRGPPLRRLGSPSSLYYWKSMRNGSELLRVPHSWCLASVDALRSGRVLFFG